MIYLDNAATTQISPTVFDAMVPYLTDRYGNPSSIYDLGSQSRDAVEEARAIIADSIGARSDEIYFTSGGTESDNWALKSAVETMSPDYIVTSEIEHHAVLNTCKYLENCIAYRNIFYAGVEKNGIIKIKMDDFNDLLKNDSFSMYLFSVMFANNEIGTIEPIQQIGEFVGRTGRSVFHVDAVQAYGHVPINVNDLHIDMMSASAHKLYGPKGIGFLYINNGIANSIKPFLHGGRQENNHRAGTENVAAIVGFGQAVKESMEHMEEWADYEKQLTDHIYERVMNEIPNVQLNGDRTQRLPNNMNFLFEGANSEAMVLLLNEEGICVSAGSACNAGSAESSHVLKAIGLTDEQARSSLRLTVSHNNTMEEIDTAIDTLKKVVAQLRSVNSDYKGKLNM